MLLQPHVYAGHVEGVPTVGENTQYIFAMVFCKANCAPATDNNHNLLTEKCEIAGYYKTGMMNKTNPQGQRQLICWQRTWTWCIQNLAVICHDDPIPRQRDASSEAGCIACNQKYNKNKVKIKVKMSQLKIILKKDRHISVGISAKKEKKKKKKREDKAPEVWARMCTEGSETESVMKVL